MTEKEAPSYKKKTPADAESLVPSIRKVYNHARLHEAAELITMSRSGRVDCTRYYSLSTDNRISSGGKKCQVFSRFL